jgi:hypothetical protein
MVPAPKAFDVSPDDFILPLLNDRVSPIVAMINSSMK